MLTDRTAGHDAPHAYAALCFVDRQQSLSLLGLWEAVQTQFGRQRRASCKGCVTGGWDQLQERGVGADA